MRRSRSRTALRDSRRRPRSLLAKHFDHPGLHGRVSRATALPCLTRTGSNRHGRTGPRRHCGRGHVRALIRQSSPWRESVGPRYERHGTRCKAPRRHIETSKHRRIEASRLFIGRLAAAGSMSSTPVGRRGLRATGFVVRRSRGHSNVKNICASDPNTPARDPTAFRHGLLEPRYETIATLLRTDTGHLKHANP